MVPRRKKTAEGPTRSKRPFPRQPVEPTVIERRPRKRKAKNPTRSKKPLPRQPDEPIVIEDDDESCREIDHDLDPEDPTHISTLLSYKCDTWDQYERRVTSLKASGYSFGMGSLLPPIRWPEPSDGPPPLGPLITPDGVLMVEGPASAPSPPFVPPLANAGAEVLAQRSNNSEERATPIQQQPLQSDVRSEENRVPAMRKRNSHENAPAQQSKAPRFAFENLSVNARGELGMLVEQRHV
ncbi:hypothetical protein LTR09_008627 [Extremus antarcticus]|uniref:Uncharacterized protein n=1 Tax=Extremus antarcticus TaxID=702011 RepID=A0AAJ0DAE7_9PEZI|nr:hypothetical protein LTR09_008627 [Extremus antarcticus]